jgi:flagellin
MTQVINTNMPSLTAQRNLETSSSKMATSLQRLSSGLRINSSKDDAAGLSIATRMQSSISGLTVAKRNANDAVSLAQIAEGALQETTNILQRARELAVQSANGTNASTDRKALQAEVNQIKSSMSSIANNTSFNGLKLLDGSLAATEFQVGALAKQTVVVSVASTKTADMGSNDLLGSATDGIMQANYNTYQEANGTALTTITTKVAKTNSIATVGAAITLTATNPDGSSATAVNVATTAADPASAIAANVNATSLAKATAFTAVRVSSLGTLDANNVLSVHINTTNATTVVGPTFNSATTYAQFATAINADANMQANGVYAISTSSGVKIVSPAGYDIGISATDPGAGNSTITAVLDNLDAQGNILGSQTMAAVSVVQSMTAVGIVSLEALQNTTVGFASAALFNSATNIKAGVRSTQNDNRLEAQTLTVAGNQGSSTVAVTQNQSAASLAVAVNAKTSTTGVSATASTQAIIQNVSVAGTVSFNLKGDNTTAVAISANITTTDFSQLIKSINDVSGTTGITAKTSGANNVIELDNALGNDIQILSFAHSAATNTAVVAVATPIVGDGSTLALPSFASIEVKGNSVDNSGGSVVKLYDGGTRGAADSTVVGGSLKFSSSASFSVSSSVDGATFSGSLFSGVAALSKASTFSSIDSVDISTVAGAQSAIMVLDQAINQLSEIRASLGSIQARFESTMRNLSNNIENLQSAMSRIMDTDFASETATLTKTQILSQAGIAILSQANSIPQGVLQLLQ